jgi:hypothetical protein
MTDQGIVRSVSVDVDLQAIERVHISDPEKRKEVGAVLTNLFYNALPQQKKDLFDQLKSDSACDDNVKHILEKEFDAFILSQAQCLGWRILLSDTILARIAKWEIPAEKDGPRLFDELGKSLALHAGILRGEARRPVPREMYGFREKTKPELKVLLRKTKLFIAANRPRGRQGWDEIIAYICRQIEGDSETFPILGGRLRGLKGFLWYLQDSYPDTPASLAERTPADFFKEWAGWAENRDPEALRQDVSKLGGQIQKL